LIFSSEDGKPPNLLVHRQLPSAPQEGRDKALFTLRIIHIIYSIRNYSSISWTNIISNVVGNFQNSLRKLRWFREKRHIITEALRQSFLLLYVPSLCILISFFPLLPKSQQTFRVGLRLMHRSPFVSARSLYTKTKENQQDPLWNIHQKFSKYYPSSRIVRVSSCFYAVYYPLPMIGPKRTKC
jgi:hypothetical protein